MMAVTVQQQEEQWLESHISIQYRWALPQPQMQANGGLLSHPQMHSNGEHQTNKTVRCVSVRICEWCLRKPTILDFNVAAQLFPSPPCINKWIGGGSMPRYTCSGPPLTHWCNLPPYSFVSIWVMWWGLFLQKERKAKKEQQRYPNGYQVLVC